VAARVGIGQPPLSQQIKDLEREVGVGLFHRIPQAAELTDAGRAFLDHVQAIPSQAERAVRAARGEIGALRVGYTGSASFNSIVTGAIRSFKCAYPDVDLSLEEDNTTRLIAGLREHLLDVVFRFCRKAVAPALSGYDRDRSGNGALHGGRFQRQSF
jgi:DNA-binding transcriptional LysR family regulator